MRSGSRRMRYTYAEYLALEEESPIRHEYLDGEIYAIAGGTPDHAALAASVLFVIGSQLPRGCRAFTSDLRVLATGLTTYSDGAVVRGGTQRAAEDAVAVTNPVVLIEVTSNSSEEYGRGEKLRRYQAVPTVQEVLILSHREPRISVHRRAASGWTSSEARSGEAVSLESLGGVVRVDDVYRDRLEDAAR